MKVLVIMGSDSDLQVMEAAARVLEEFGVSHEMTVASAHRSPERVLKLVAEAEKKGAQAVIAGAGMAAHLAGVVASSTALPVIGVPLATSPLGGLDSLLSTVQMPPGVPVATVAIGKAGAKNAAYLALRILSLKDKALARKLKAHKKRMAADVEKKAAALKKQRPAP
jgi:phosphoribosylaminoimidazole carboxylase PurE protein